MEAHQFIRENPLFRIIFLTRGFTERFVENLYTRGAVNAIVVETKRSMSSLLYAGEMWISTDNRNKRAVLAEIVRAVPWKIEEVGRNQFRVYWDLSKVVSI